MSKENHPNLHAVGLLTDVLRAIQARLRGKAGEAGMATVMHIVTEPTNLFVARIDELLDHYFGGPQIAMVPEVQIDAAQQYLENLPDNPLYQVGMVHYPPRGQRDIAALMAAWFEYQMNSIVAPVTQAWTDFKIDTITVKPGDIRENDATFTLTLTAMRRKP